MFKTARLKLTAWYLLIIMIISGFFSLVIYQVIINEVTRFANQQRFRIERRLNDSNIFPQPVIVFDNDLVEETHRRLLNTLIIINLSILFGSGILGYILAGKTLSPIQSMLDDQTRFISDASHELKTPITALKTSLEVGLRDPHLSPTDSHQLLIDSLTDVNHLQRLTEKLLKFNRVQSSQPLTLSRFSASKLFKYVITNLRPIANSSHIKLVGESNHIKLIADFDRLSEALTILVDNAIKYSPPRTIVTMSIKLVSNQIHIAVADQGIGISPIDQRHIFDRFYRVDSSRTEGKKSGFGLGLSIAKNLIDSHHGSIEVQSQVGVGSVFTIKLPQNFS